MESMTIFFSIGHDNAGGFADWYLDCVDIDCPSLGKKWHFNCDKWLSNSKDDRQLERELYPSELGTESYETCTFLKMTRFLKKKTDKKLANTNEIQATF